MKVNLTSKFTWFLITDSDHVCVSHEQHQKNKFKEHFCFLFVVCVLLISMLCGY